MAMKDMPCKIRCEEDGVCTCFPKKCDEVDEDTCYALRCAFHYGFDIAKDIANKNLEEIKTKILAAFVKKRR